jgi:DNA primase
MPKSRFVDFRAVKSAITMEQVLTHYRLIDQFKKGKDSLSGPCPIHKGTNPTQFRVSVSKNVWNCFSECQHGGNVLDFIAKMEDVSIHAAALKAIEWFNLDPETISRESAEETTDSLEPQQKPEVSQPKPASKPSPAAAQDDGGSNKPLKFRLEKLEREHPYLMKDRGLKLETIVDFGIGYCAKGTMAERIAIPIHNPECPVVAYAGRFPGEPGEDTPKYKLPQGFRKSLELFNIDRVLKEPPETPLVIVEGFFDCMKLHEHGLKKVVALMGSTMSDAQEALIRKCTDRHSQIIVMLDEDEAGIAGREDIAVRLSKFTFVKVHTFNEPGKQPDQLTEAEAQEILGDAP